MRRFLKLLTVIASVIFSRSVRVTSSSGGIGTAATSRANFDVAQAAGLGTAPSYVMGNQRSLPAIRVDQNGKVFTAQILKQQLANELGLPLRDLRIVDPSFPTQIQATFIVRPKALLFSLENIKVVVKSNEALVFSPFLSETQEFIPLLQQQIAQIREGDTVQRFEHAVIEAALGLICSSLSRRVRALSPAVASALRGLRAESRGLDVLQTQVDELLPLKNQLDEMRKRVKEIQRAITDILNNDDDMNMMCLVAAPLSTSDSTSVSSSLFLEKNIGSNIHSKGSDLINGAGSDTAAGQHFTNDDNSAESIGIIPSSLAQAQAAANPNLGNTQNEHSSSRVWQSTISVIVQYYLSTSSVLAQD